MRQRVATVREVCAVREDVFLDGCARSLLLKHVVEVMQVRVVVAAYAPLSASVRRTRGIRDTDLLSPKCSLKFSLVIFREM